MKSTKQVFDDMQRFGLTDGQLTLAVEYVIRERNEAFSDGMQAVVDNPAKYVDHLNNESQAL